MNPVSESLSSCHTTWSTLRRTVMLAQNIPAVHQNQCVLLIHHHYRASQQRRSSVVSGDDIDMVPACRSQPISWYRQQPTAAHHCRSSTQHTGQTHLYDE